LLDLAVKKTQESYLNGLNQIAHKFDQESLYRENSQYCSHPHIMPILGEFPSEFVVYGNKTIEEDFSPEELGKSYPLPGSRFYDKTNGKSTLKDHDIEFLKGIFEICIRFRVKRKTVETFLQMVTLPKYSVNVDGTKEKEKYDSDKGLQLKAYFFSSLKSGNEYVLIKMLLELLASQFGECVPIELTTEFVQLMRSFNILQNEQVVSTYETDIAKMKDLTPFNLSSHKRLMKIHGKKTIPELEQEKKKTNG